MESHALGWVAVVLYLGAEVYSILSLVRPRVPALPGHVMVGAGLALQFADLEVRARALQSVPYRTIGGSLSLFGWMLGLSYLALLFRHRERADRTVPDPVRDPLLDPRPVAAAARPAPRGRTREAPSSPCT